MFCWNFEQTIRNTAYDRFAVVWHFLAYLAAFRAKTPQDARHAGEQVAYERS
jgi:hypothetical protein